jgi:hypothetical protein
MLPKGFGNVVRLRGSTIVSNNKNEGSHATTAILENQGQPSESYRRLDCEVLVTNAQTCTNCSKLENTMVQIRKRYHGGVVSIKSAHASPLVLIEQLREKRKVIYFYFYFLFLFFVSWTNQLIMINNKNYAGIDHQSSGAGNKSTYRKTGN